MGSWSIAIHGHGIHDNGKDEDVDAILQRFINELNESGQVLNAVHLTVGSGRDFIVADTVNGITRTEYF
jgi:hypothetical protein